MFWSFVFLTLQIFVLSDEAPETVPRSHNGPFSVGDQIDALWPPDKYGETKLKDIRWPGVINSVDLGNELYSISYEGGDEYEEVPFDWVFPRSECVDQKPECLALARKGECKTKIQKMYTECRLSCKACTKLDTGSKPKDEDPSEDKEWKEFQLEIRRLRFGEKKSLENRDPKEAERLLLVNLETHENGDNQERLNWLLNTLGVLYLFGGSEDSELPKDEDKAFDYFAKSAESGNTDGQFYLGYLYSLRDQESMALLYYYFAASGGSISASLALGFKHEYGIGAPKSCESALQYHSDVAEQVVKNPEKTSRETARLDDTESGQDLSRMEKSEVENLINYQEALADNGDIGAQVMLGQIYRHGAPPFIDARPEQAVQRFRQAINDGRDNPVLGQAHAAIASMYIDGNGVEQSNQTAFEHMQKSADANTAEGMFGLAQMHHHGIGTKVDMKAAVKYYKQAADKNVADAQFHLGMLYFSGVGVSRDYASALKLFSKSAVQGHLQGIYYVGWMHRNGLATAKSCRMALQLMTAVSHRSSVAEVSNLARRFHKMELYDEAFGYYALASELGFEVSQYNAAYMASREQILPDDEEARFKLAYRYYGYSADQGNSQAQRILGDFYYYLWHPVANQTAQNETHPEESLHYREAVYYYDLAAKNPTKPNAHAMWNLGYMHHYGLGRPRDFDIAKRYYDQARLLSSNAYLPSLLSLAVLYVECGYDLWMLPTWESILNAGGDSVGPSPWYLSVENIVLLCSAVLLIILVTIRLYQQQNAAAE